MDDRKGSPAGERPAQRVRRVARRLLRDRLFIALEGGEGAGKSTQAELLGEWLRAEGYDVLLTHEPGDTEVGQKLRRIVLDPATGEHLPPHRGAALRRRQGRARRPGRRARRCRGARWWSPTATSTRRWPTRAPAATSSDRELERVARWATADLRPHLTVLLDLPPQTGPDPVRGARPDRGRVGGVPRAGARGVPPARRRRPRALPGGRRAAARSRRSRPSSGSRVEPLLEQAVRGPARAGQATPAAAHRPPPTRTRGPPPRPSSTATRARRWSRDHLSRPGLRARARHRVGLGRPRRPAAAIETLQPRGRRPGDDPRLAVHRPARLRPVQRGAGLRRRAAVRAGRLRASARPAAPRSPARHPDVSVTRTEPRGDPGRRDARPGAALGAGPGRPPLAGDGGRGRRPAQRHAGNALLKAIEEPTAAHRVAAVRAHGRGRAAHDPLPLPQRRARHADHRGRRRLPGRAATACPTALAAFAARASQGHIGRARALALDEKTRNRRHEVVSHPAAADLAGRLHERRGNLVDLAKDETDGDHRGHQRPREARRARRGLRLRPQGQALPRLPGGAQRARPTARSSASGAAPSTWSTGA